MKKLICSLLFVCVALLSFGQGSISGKAIDNTQTPLIGASVFLEGSTMGGSTDYDGNFTISDVPAGTYNLMISYVGFDELKQSVTVGSGNVNLGEITVKESAIGLKEVSVIASIAIDRKTPVAVSTLSTEYIAEKLGSQEFPEVLKMTPSVYATKTGGGYGDSRINIRGFDQRNMAVMINGIPVNDMENGWVYWSNWAGLADVTSNMQVQRGLGASKLAVPSVGGSINIITNAAEMKKGGAVTVGVGNDNAQRYGLVLSTGEMDNGWAFSAQGTFRKGDGYINGTAYEAYSYFVSATKRFNAEHSISFTGLGAPQWHHQRTTDLRFDNVTLYTYRREGIKFNHQAGTLGGEEFSWRKNFYHKPKVFVNHYWTISDKTDLKTSAYVSLGRGGGTGARGRLNTSDGRVYNTLTAFGQGAYDENGQVRFDDIVAYNSGQEVADWGQQSAETDGTFSTTSSGNGFIRRASMNEHNWYGVLSNITHTANENLTFTGGLDVRYYKGLHYRRVEDLLGNDSYQSRSDDNNPANFITAEGRADGNVIAYNNDGLVNWIGLYGQVEYTKEKLSAFVSLSGSNQGFKRVDYFNYLDSDSEQTTDWQNFLGGTLKAGFNYNLDDYSNIFVNGGVFSKQPIFDNVFINFRNDINEDVQNQNIYSFEAGYGLRTSTFKGNINLYHTVWQNRQFNRSLSITSPVTGDQVSALFLFDNVGQTHTGLEFEAKYTPVRNLEITGMLSLGDWYYTSNFESKDAYIADEDISVPGETRFIYGDGLKVGDAAQTTYGLGLAIRPFGLEALRIFADFNGYSDLYARFDIDDFNEPGGQVIELPSYQLVDLGASYKFDVQDYNCTFRLNVNNLFNTEYVSELYTNNTTDFLANKGFYGFGRTWSTSLKIRF